MIKVINCEISGSLVWFPILKIFISPTYERIFLDVESQSKRRNENRPRYLDAFPECLDAGHRRHPPDLLCITLQLILREWRIS